MIILIDVISNGYATDSNLSKVRLIRTVILKEWQVRFWHVPREQNKDVDCITKMPNRDLNAKCYFDEPRSVFEPYWRMIFNNL